MKEQSIYQIKEEMNKSNQTSDAQRWCLVGFNIWCCGCVCVLKCPGWTSVLLMRTGLVFHFVGEILFGRLAGLGCAWLMQHVVSSRRSTALTSPTDEEVLDQVTDCRVHKYTSYQREISFIVCGLVSCCNRNHQSKIWVTLGSPTLSSLFVSQNGLWMERDLTIGWEEAGHPILRPLQTSTLDYTSSDFIRYWKQLASLWGLKNT